MSADQTDRRVARTRDGGVEIVKFLKTGSAYYAPAELTDEERVAFGSSVAAVRELVGKLETVPEPT